MVATLTPGTDNAGPSESCLWFVEGSEDEQMNPEAHGYRLALAAR